MKKGIILLSVLLIVTMIPSAFAGANNTVSDAWYYNDPDGSAYLDAGSGSFVPPAVAPVYTSDSYSYDASIYYYDDPDYDAYYPNYSYTYPDYSYTPSRSSYSGLGYRTLKRTYPCMRGSDVRSLQTMLNALGYSCGRADGIFGDRTKAAVKSFQRRNGLKVDGIVGPATRSRLLSRYRNR